MVLCQSNDTTSRSIRRAHKGSKAFKYVKDIAQIGDSEINALKYAIKRKEIENQKFLRKANLSAGPKSSENIDLVDNLTSNKNLANGQVHLN